jgi:competence protein ComGC
MSIINFTRHCPKYQQYILARCYEGFLCIELIVTLLVMSILLLITSYYHVLSLQWQQDAIKRFEAINAVYSWIACQKRAQVVESQGNETIGQFTLSWRREPQTVSGLDLLTHPAIALPTVNLDITWFDAAGHERHIPFVTAFGYAKDSA